MDDLTFEQWSNALLELRQGRRNAIDIQIDLRNKKYAANELFDYLQMHLDQVLTQWWAHESHSWEENPPADPTLAAENIKSELESTIDFEVDAEMEDMEYARKSVSFNDGEIEKGKNSLKNYADELKRTYKIKIDDVCGIAKAKAIELAKATTSTTRIVHVNKNSSMGLLTMFFIGLGLGGGVAYYFHEVAQKAEAKLVEEREKLNKEKKEFINDLTSLQETYYQLALGKLLNLPDIERAMNPIKKNGKAQMAKIEADYAKAKENLLRKISAGDRLDKALRTLKEEKDNRLEEVQKDIDDKLQPYLKQKQLHEELIKQR